MVVDFYIERIAGGGLLVLSGLVARALQLKTRIPDVFFLMLIGMLAGPVFGVVNAANYEPLMLLFTSLVLALLMFWVGSGLRIVHLMRGFATNLIFTIIAYSLTFCIVVLLGTQVFNLPFFPVVLIAILMSDTCPTIINSVVNGIRLTKPGKVGMVIESSISNALGLGLFLGVYKFAPTGSIDLSAMGSVLNTFAIAILLGGMFGLGWIMFMRKTQRTETFTWLTLAGLLLMYAIVEYLQAAAPISAFIFGLMCANAQWIDKKLGLAPRKLPFSFGMQEHILFFVRTAFFIYMGLLFPVYNIQFDLLTFVATALIMVGIMRTGLVFVMPQAFTKKDVIAQAYVYPTGFSVVVLTLLPAAHGFAVPYLTEAIIYAVMVSNLISALGTRLHGDKKLIEFLKPKATIS